MAFAQGGVDYEWAFKIGGTGNENIRDIQVSASGYVYIGGGFQGTVDFDPGPGTTNLTSVGSNDMFFAKYTSTGDLVWVNKFGGNGDDYVFGLALGENDSVIIAGYFGSTTAVDFDPGTGTALLGPASIVDGLVAKYDSSGNYAWANRIFGTSVDNIYDVVLDGDQNIYVTGTHTSGTLTFSTTPAISISSAGGNDAFLAKFDRNGVCQFANRIAGNGNDLGRSIAIDNNGDLFVAGQFTRTCDFDPSAGTANLVTPFSSDVNGFIAKYSNTGTYLWANSMGGTSTTGNDIAFAVETDASGNAWVCGQFYGVATFSPFSVTGTNNVNAFVAKYNTSGTCTFASGMAGTGSEAAAYAIDVDAANNVYVSGGFKGTIDFDLATGGSNIKNLTSNPTTANDAFMAKYTNAGAYLWANRIGGTTSDESFSFRVIDNTEFYMGGYFQGTADMDPKFTGQNLTSGGANDAFLARYSQCTPPAAPAAISGIDTSCSSFQGQVFTATPVTGATSYTWSLPGGWTGSSTTNVITISSNMVGGTITVTANDGCGTSLPTTKTIAMVFPPSQPASITGANNVCPGSTQVYTAPTPAGVDFYTWTLPSGWSGTSTTNTITVTAGTTQGNVSVAYNNFCGASTPRDFFVQVLSPPNGSISPAAPTICSGGSVTLTASGGTSYAWSNGLGIGASKTVSPTTTTDYIVTVSHTANICTDVDTVTVTVLGALAANITPASPEICSGQSVTLTATGGGTYAWSNGGGTGASASFSPTTTTTYTVTVTNGSCTATASKTVTVNTTPTASISPATATICNGGSITLTASGGSSYAWSNSGGSNASATFSPTTNTTYTVTVTNGNCSATASRLVTVNALPTPSITPATVAICIGESATLTASGGTTYAWSNSLGAGASKTVSPTATTTYTVTVTNSNSCTASASRTVTVNALPTAAISPSSATICTGASQTLTASGGTSYAWSNSLGSGATKNVTPTSNTTYSVTVTNANNCTASASASITLNPITVITTEPLSQSSCTGSSVSFTVAANGVGLSYQWRKNGINIGSANGATYTIPSVAAGDAANYTVIVNGTCGADTSTVAALTVVTSASISQQPQAQTVCVGQPISLSVTGSGGNNTTYQWFKGNTSLSTQTSATLSIPAASVSDAGNYHVIISGSCGTISSDTVAVTVNAIPVASISPATATICLGQSQTLTASGGGTYAWSNAGGSSATANFSPTTNTTFTVTVTNNGCSATTTATINVTPLPTPVILPIGLPVEICAGNSVTLTANGGGSYSWSGNGSTGSIITVSPASTTTYTVTVTTNGCSATASKQVIVNALPNVSISPANASICPGSSQTLTASGASTYTWSNGLGAGTSKAVSPTTNTVYSVTGTDANGCLNTATANISLNTATNITSEPIAQSTCVGGSVTLSVTAVGNNLSYQWRKDGTNIVSANGNTFNIASANLADAGNYNVIVSGDCGADTSITVAISVTGSLTVSQQPQPVTTCEGNSAFLTVIANGANITYEWTFNGNPIANSNNDTLFLSNLTTANAGNYACNITSSCGNASSNAALVTVNTATSSTFTQSVCFGDTYFFNNQTLSTSGTYLDTLTNAANCDSFVTLILTVSPRINTILNEVLCDGSSLTFNGQTINTAGQYLDTLVSATSCDSFITLNVSIALATDTTITESVCGAYSFGGASLTASGVYTDTLVNLAGCDSIITLDLTILQGSTSAIADTICNGDSYTFGSQTLSQSGSYTETLSNAAGCDSVVTLDLFVRPALSVAITQIGADLSADMGYSTYQWQFNGTNIDSATSDSYTATQNGDYTVIVTDGNNCTGTAANVTVTGLAVSNINNQIVLKLYPNPANDFITIESSEQIIGYEIQNLLGQTVMQSSQFTGSISISALAPSAYIILINTHKGMAVQKFFVER